MRASKILTVGVLALVAIVTGVVIINRRSEVAVVEKVPIAHVHGLGLNPADGSLIIATHTGSFRLAVNSSKPTRIGTSYQDTMGFTVAGPNHFIGSGHPDVPGRLNGQPSLLGLIESANAGLTWTVRSLSGEADFHGLVITGGQTFGWDSTSGKLMVSSDLVNWETRSTVDLLAFVVDPFDTSQLVGASPTGLIQSSDGGRTWKQLAGPALEVLSWTKDSVLQGVDQIGTVWLRVGG